MSSNVVFREKGFKSPIPHLKKDVCYVERLNKEKDTFFYKLGLFQLHFDWMIFYKSFNHSKV